jgi:kynureninase
MLTLESALQVYEGIDLADVRRRSLSLTGFLMDCLDALAPQLPLRTPREPSHRGSQVAVAHPSAYGVVQALATRGVVGDYREPDVVRLGVAPLYLRHADMLTAAEALAGVVAGREFDDPRYRRRSTVT